MTMNPAALANPRSIATRLKSVSKGKAAGQRRHDMRIGKQPKYVDGNRTNLNRHLIEAMTPAELVQICEYRREKSGVKRQRKVASNVAVATIGIITFGREAQVFMQDMPSKQQDKMFQEVAEKIAARLGTSITGLSVHLDESALHAHYQMPATTINGGPVSRIMTKAVLNEIQTLAAEVAQKYDPRLERGNRKIDRLEAGADYADTVHKTVRQMHDTLIPERDQLSAAIDDLNDQISAQYLKQKKNADYLEKQKKKLEETAGQIDQNTAKIATAENRIKKYETRIDNGEAELERLEGLRKAAQIAYEANLAQGRAKGREEGLQALRDAREAAQALAGGELVLPNMTNLAQTIRTLTLKAQKTARHESDNRHRNSSSTIYETRTWQNALQRYQQNLPHHGWQDLASSIKDAHEAGKAALDNTKSQKTGSLVDRVLNVARSISEYWSGIAQAFVENLGDRIPNQEIMLGIACDTLSRPANEYEYLQPLIQEAQQEVQILNLAEKLAVQSSPSPE